MIINRNLDISEKKVIEDAVVGAVATGATTLLRIVPYPALLQGVYLSAFGISGSPVYSLSVFRPTAGGLTAVPLGITVSAQAYGTSGPVGASIAGAGVTMLAGDMLYINSGGANSAIASGVVTTLVACLTDFKTYPNTVS